MTGATSAAETAYPPRAPEFITPSFSGLRVAQSLVCCKVSVDHCIVLSFGHCIVCPSTASD